MPMGYCRVQPDKSAFVELEGFRPLTSDGFADVLTGLVARYEDGLMSSDTLETQVFYWLCQTRSYGEPAPLPIEVLDAEMRDRFDEVMRKPVPANLWGER